MLCSNLLGTSLRCLNQPVPEMPPLSPLGHFFPQCLHRAPSPCASLGMERPWSVRGWPLRRCGPAAQCPPCFPTPGSQANVPYRPCGPFQSGTGFQPVASSWEKARDFRRADSSRISPWDCCIHPLLRVLAPCHPGCCFVPQPPVRLPGCWQPVPRTELRTTHSCSRQVISQKLLGSPAPSCTCPALRRAEVQSLPSGSPTPGPRVASAGTVSYPCSLLRLGIQAPPHLRVPGPLIPSRLMRSVRMGRTLVSCGHRQVMPPPLGGTETRCVLPPLQRPDMQTRCRQGLASRRLWW